MGILLVLCFVLCGIIVFLHRENRTLRKLKRQHPQGYETHELLFENMGEGCAYCQLVFEGGAPRDWLYLSVNEAFEKQTGLKNVTGKRVSEVIPGIRESDQELFKIFARVSQTRKPESFEIFVKSLNEWFWISAYSSKPGFFTAVFQVITERKSSEARVQRLTQLYAALSQCNHAIMHFEKVEELYPAICRIVVEHGGLKMAWIAMLDEDGRQVRPAAAYGNGIEYLNGIEISLDADNPFGRGPTGTAIRENKPVWCQDFQNDASTEPWREHSAQFGWGGSASLPLHLKGKTIGALTIYSERSQAFDEEVRGLLTEMAEDISFGIESSAREKERKHSEEQALLNRTMLAQVINSIPHSVFWKDRNSVYLGCNVVFARSAGLKSPEEIVGKTDFEFPWVGQGAHGYIADDREVMENLLPKRHIIETVKQADGNSILVDTTKVPLADSEGCVYGVLGVFEDITERSRAEEELQTLRKAVEQSANAIIITDTTGKIEYVNPAFQKSTGFTAAEAIGRNPNILKSGEQNAAFYQELWTTISSGRIWRGQFHNKTKDGALYWVSATISPVYDATGKIRHFIAINEDFTALKSLEASLLDALARAESASRAKSEFLAVMSHELRTPLNGVLGFAELLSTALLDVEQKEYLQTIRNCGEHLLNIVNDILDFSSIEKGSMRLESAPVIVSSLVEESCLIVRKAATDKGLDFHCALDPTVPVEISGDGRRIRQILINLLGNAVKFTSQGSILLTVSPGIIDQQPTLDFSVKDTGAGIPSTMIGDLFEPFTQVDSSLHRQFEGTGLGLAISKRLVEAMGGTINVVSTLGQGSTFTFRIPIGSSAISAFDERAESLVSTSRPTARNLVLVVEDDPSSSALAGKMLQSLGYQVEFAFNGKEAVEAFVPGKYFAIVMDIQMRVMNGLTAVKMIREIESSTGGEHVPVIALTANVMPGDRDRCLAAGMDEYLSKPFRRVDLEEKLMLYAHKEPQISG